MMMRHDQGQNISGTVSDILTVLADLTNRWQTVTPSDIENLDQWIKHRITTEWLWSRIRIPLPLCFGQNFLLERCFTDFLVQSYLLLCVIVRDYTASHVFGRWGNSIMVSVSVCQAVVQARAKIQIFMKTLNQIWRSLHLYVNGHIPKYFYHKWSVQVCISQHAYIWFTGTWYDSLIACTCMFLVMEHFEKLCFQM